MAISGGPLGVKHFRGPSRGSCIEPLGMIVASGQKARLSEVLRARVARQHFYEYGVAWLRISSYRGETVTAHMVRVSEQSETPH